MLSDFRGVPLVDSDAFLKSVDFGTISNPVEVLEGIKASVIFPFTQGIVSLNDSPIVTVFTEPSVFTGKPAPCPDFSLVSEGVDVGKGYLVTIGTPDTPDILRLVFNVLGFVAVSHGGAAVRTDYASRVEKRRKLLDGSVAGLSD